jgi:hypothetical protein
LKPHKVPKYMYRFKKMMSTLGLNQLVVCP